MVSSARSVDPEKTDGQRSCGKALLLRRVHEAALTCEASGRRVFMLWWQARWNGPRQPCRRQLAMSQVKRTLMDIPSICT
mmetsp:Transcript_17010/g.46131  ORF Transcript_17010/g.46131 Transcript_17010/m.46131 type:complete len:80 (+) Transcript_17010:38-277(+)